ncbi:MAG: carboxypeptidase regulatory-like domain-containing protein, partial [Candidatus Thermoplasmatota archaeon]
MGALHYLKIVLLLFIVMINISFSPALRNARGEENSVLEGYIKDAETNEPIPDVNVHIGTDGQDKETNTDLSGHYVFTVSAGSYHIDVGKEGYSDYHDWITIGENDRVWYNITLYKKPLENSTLKGYVINAQTGYPVVNAWVDVQAGTYRNGTSTWYNGYYELRTIAGTLTVRCGAHNYFDTETVVVMVENQTTWLNLTLYPAPPENSILKGYVLEYKTSLPVVDAFVYVNDRKQWDTGTYTIAAGYYEKSVIAGELWIVVSMSGYLSNKTKFSIAEFETKWLNITLYPELPENATLKGFVNDSFTGNVLSAELEVYGYGSWKKSTWSDYNGYYEMTVVPADLTLLVSAGQHAPNTTYFNITSDETKWLNISLERDELLPELTNITISINTNIGPNNPTQINGTIKEGYLRWGLVAFLEYLTEELGLKKYAFRTGYSTKEDGPLQLELLNLTLVQPGVYNFTLNWNATLPESGWLANETVKDYVGIDWYDAGRQVIEGSYYNATNPTPVDADAYFQRDGKLQKLRLYSGIELMPPFDPTGNFGARQQ